MRSPSDHTSGTGLVAAAVLLPAAGFVLLLTNPHLDVHWEDHRAHFWLVLGAAVLTGALAYATGEAAQRRGDLRLGLVSLTFLCSAGFLGLHALATPGVLLDTPNLGFVIAVPLGLVLASAIAALSASDALSRRYRTLSAHRRTGAALVVAVSFILLSEAVLQTALSRNWHASWWEWHVLMLAAFGLVALAARREWREERFADLYLEETARGRREVSVVSPTSPASPPFRRDAIRPRSQRC